MSRHRINTAILIICLIILSLCFYYIQTPRYYINNANSLLKEAVKADNEIFEKNTSLALDSLSKGIKKYPNRLDIRLGKMFLCRMIKNAACIKDEVLETILFSQSSATQWQWSKGEARNNEFMLEAVQVYQKALFEAGQDAEVYQIAAVILKYYPQHVPSLNSLGLIYALENNLEKAEEFLTKAHKLAPDDEIVNKNLLELERRKKQ